MDNNFWPEKVPFKVCSLLCDCSLLQCLAGAACGCSSALIVPLLTEWFR